MPLALVIGAGYVIISAVMPLAEAGQWLSLVVALGVSGLLYGVGCFVLVVVLKVDAADTGGRILLVDRLPAGLEIENLNIAQGEAMGSVTIDGIDRIAVVPLAFFMQVILRGFELFVAVLGASACTAAIAACSGISGVA